MPRPAALFGVLVLLVAGCVPRPPVVVPDDPPPPPGDPLLPAHLDCPRWRYDGVLPTNLPPEWDDEDYRFGSWRDPGSARSPHRLCGQLGAAVDLAWNVTTGSPDVLIAVLDSGVEWRDPAKMRDLLASTYLNRGELPPPLPTPPGADPYDANGDGRFDVFDYADDPRIDDLNANELLDPEDLILSELSDGVDDDGNGWVDDISGWDLLDGDNNPLDDVGYGHGTGEARDSTAAHDGQGAAGTCPQCRHLPVRVGDSFIAEGGRFAAGVLFSLDSGADVLQEALGAISNPPQVQQAIDAAYRRGVPVVASMADEQSQHPNLPAALDHTIPVNSLTEGPGFISRELSYLTGRRDALALNGCTNIGGITWVSVPSDGCSSEATGNSAGMVGLIEAAARQAGTPPHPDLLAAGFAGSGANVLSAEEVAQILRATADDVDFSTPNAVDPPNEVFDDFGQERFPTVRGWDGTTGYGRVNAYEAVKAVAAGEIPPEAEIRSPEWFSLHPVTGGLAVEGRVAAVRSSSYSYRLEWAVGMQTEPHPAADAWHVAATGSALTAPVDGLLGTIDLAEVAAALPGAGRGTPSTGGLPEHDRFTIRVRVVVTDAEGRVGTRHRLLMVHDDPTGGVVSAPSGLGTSSPAFHDLDGDGADELVIAGDDGRVHALRPDGSQLPGWPVRTAVPGAWPESSSTALAEGIRPPGAAVLVGAPAIADLDGSGGPEVVVTDADGEVSVFDARGSLEARMAVDAAFSRSAATDELNRLKHGFYGSAALGDLDGDQDLEIVAAAADRHVYAWHHDGRPVAGFPVLLVDPAEVAATDPVTHVVTFRDEDATGIGGELIATPALADLTGDERPEIVVGAQEQYDEAPAVWPPIGIPTVSGNTRLYAIHPEGVLGGGPERSAAHPDEQAYLRGWPVAVPMLKTEVLPAIGDGVATQAAIGDVDGDHQAEVVVASAAGQLMAFDADGTSPYAEWSGLQIAPGWLGATSFSNSTDTALLSVAFGGPSLGRVGTTEQGSGAGGGLDIVAPTVGLLRALDTLLTNRQPSGQHISVWHGATGQVRGGWPRATADLAFFVTPAIVDVDGDGANEAVAANGLQMLDGFSGDGSSPAGWPKLTGGWSVGTPAAGDWDGDGSGEIAIVRRDGPLLVWRLPTASTALGDWVRFGGGPHNTGAHG